jgi:cell division protein ZapA (FtsZ GTPase activity inhibitor)
MDIKILTTKVKLQHLLERIKVKGENENLDEQQTLIEAILLISELQKQSTKHYSVASEYRHKWAESKMELRHLEKRCKRLEDNFEL